MIFPPQPYPYAGISLTGSTATTAQARKLDDILDDGNLASGAFRLTPNGRYTYIIAE